MHRNLRRKLYTVGIFVKISTRRFFRDKVAIFFTVAFPLIFLFVFGGIFGNNSDVSFKVAVLNHSDTKIAEEFTKSLKDQNKLFKISDDVTSISKANEKMARGELDATIEIPKDFGATRQNEVTPSGKVIVHYTQNNQQAAATLSSILEAQFKQLNGKYVSTDMPFTVETKQNNERSLSSFDYTFAGLLGFSILGLGIFGPVNVFPELKKQGILRRLHTTPLRVWQYFLATMASQAIIGLITLAFLMTTAFLGADFIFLL